MVSSCEIFFWVWVERIPTLRSARCEREVKQRLLHNVLLLSVQIDCRCRCQHRLLQLCSHTLRRLDHDAGGAGGACEVIIEAMAVVVSTGVTMRVTGTVMVMVMVMIVVPLERNEASHACLRSLPAQIWSAKLRRYSRCWSTLTQTPGPQSMGSNSRMHSFPTHARVCSFSLASASAAS
eukprot:3519779-Rhodomonas_salina.2